MKRPPWRWVFCDTCYRTFGQNRPCHVCCQSTVQRAPTERRVLRKPILLDEKG